MVLQLLHQLDIACSVIMYLPCLALHRQHVCLSGQISRYDIGVQWGSTHLVIRADMGKDGSKTGERFVLELALMRWIAHAAPGAGTAEPGPI